MVAFFAVNNDYGFKHVMQHQDSIKILVSILRFKDYKTNALVLDLLAAVCLVGAKDNGHQRTLQAFDKFKAE